MVEHLVSDALKTPPRPSPEEAQAIMVDALRKLSFLGNGLYLGTSESNIIAQRALIKAGFHL